MRSRTRLPSGFQSMSSLASPFRSMTSGFAELLGHSGLPMLLDMKPVCLAALALVIAVTPAWADDCTQPKAAMMVSAKTPYSETIVSTGPGGKAVTSHLIQTATTKYVEHDGRWTSLPMSSAEIVDALNDMLKTAKITCKRTGAERVNGQPTTIYTVHLENEGVVTDSTIWISDQNRQLKSTTTSGGKQFSSTFDYDHVQPPAGAKPLGQR